MSKKYIATLLLLLSTSFLIVSCGNKNSNIKTLSPNTSNTKNSDNSEINISKENDLVTNDVRIYYYDIQNDTMTYINKTIEIKDKAIATSLFNELKRSPAEGFLPSISNDVSLNSANLVKEENMIKLDFSSNLINTQNLGSGAESNTLKAICNTFGSFFNVDKVMITLDGSPYSSGHILMNEGEWFEVDLTNATELVK